MNTRMRNVVWAGFLVVLLGGTVGWGAEDTFNLILNTNGQIHSGGGSGYGNGQWHYYPNSGYYTQWFDNRPYTPNAYKRVNWALTIKPWRPGAPAQVEVAINWSSDQWDAGQGLPLPNYFGNDWQLEDTMIKREVVLSDSTFNYTVALHGFYDIPNYCPAYISIDIQGVNADVSGSINHVCFALEPDTEACCFDDGSCQDLSPDVCRRLGGDPQGSGTTCDTVSCRPYDYGDAPDPTYPTLQASSGAYHFVDNRIYLGKKVDTEGNGQPNATATGDDLNFSDDEDGVVFTSALVAGSSATVDVEASIDGRLHAWIDFNGDGDWADVGEKIFVNKPLVAGVNPLSFNVPASAAEGLTYARFRYSTLPNLNYTGYASNGEVEDYQIRIQKKQPPVEPDYIPFKWEQPPIEYNPQDDYPTYCGWDLPAYVVLQGNYPGTYTPATNWMFAADDFRCFGSMPITSIHWWGSYVNWTQKVHPDQRPNGWVVGFWSNVAAGVDADYSHPGSLLKVFYVPATQVKSTWVGYDRFPNKPADTCFRYRLDLRPDQVFWQEDYIKNTQDRVFWLSISAVYQGYATPRYPWGWKTRPAHWMDDAVSFSTRSTSIGVGWKPEGPAAIGPLKSDAICHQVESYDLSFALDTDPNYVKWNQPFTGLRQWEYYEDQVSVAEWGGAASSIAIKWEQPPDLTRTGIDVDATDDIPPTWPAVILADDFECKTSGPITEIEVWGSWLNDTLVGNDPANARFTLSIHQDIPATSSHTGYSQPGTVLWSKVFQPGEFAVSKQQAEIESFYHPINKWYLPLNHYDVYRYSFSLDDQAAFQQTGTNQQPVVYWLSVQAYLIHAPNTKATRWGWKTSTQEWNDVAVYAAGSDPHNANWQMLKYPAQHPYYDRKSALAFRITTSQQSYQLKVVKQVADDWLCDSAHPITAAVWWGSYVGHHYNACACPQEPAPQKPLYFWLSLWTDIPDPDPTNLSTYSQPNQLVWQYQAFNYDEVLVGYDRSPLAATSDTQYEGVYRYSVRIPRKDWFYQPGQQQVYWFSVVAVYPDLSTVPYRWGWTNHAHVYNDNAVTSLFPYDPPSWNSVFWSPLFENSGAKEDLSFMLFTDPNEYRSLEK